MAIVDDLIQQVGLKESETLEYKAVLIPSRSMAQMLCAFANTKGGYLILGVSDNTGKPEVKGISPDFNVRSMVHKAIDQLDPAPEVKYSYFTIQGKSLFGIYVAPSQTLVRFEGRVYVRDKDKAVEKDKAEIRVNNKSYPRLKSISEQFKKDQVGGTAAKFKFLEHYQSVLKLYDDGHPKIFPAGPTTPTTLPEGRILNRILFSSCIDNFETYLSDLLYEIYLANPNTLRGGDATVKVSEVLDCADRDEFICYYAGRRIRRLQKGSVKGFVKENKEISALGAITDSEIDDIERVLQIRHLYSHRNGIVDESFFAYFPTGYPLNTEHVLSVEQVLDQLTFLARIINSVDVAAIAKYSLASVA